MTKQYQYIHIGTLLWFKLGNEKGDTKELITLSHEIDVLYVRLLEFEQWLPCLHAARVVTCSVSHWGGEQNCPLLPGQPSSNWIPGKNPWKREGGCHYIDRITHQVLIGL